MSRKINAVHKNHPSNKDKVLCGLTLIEGRINWTNSYHLVTCGNCLREMAFQE